MKVDAYFFKSNHIVTLKLFCFQTVLDDLVQISVLVGHYIHLLIIVISRQPVLSVTRSEQFKAEVNFRSQWSLIEITQSPSLTLLCY